MGANLASGATLWKPSGPKWVAFRQRLFAGWARTGQLACFACGCPVNGPAAGEIEHRISTRLRPDLAWEQWWKGERFLVPVHGSGKKRCPVHDLACNAVIGSNAARRDELGRSLPLTPEEIAAAQARAAERPRSGTGRDRRKSRGSAAKPRETAETPKNPRGTPVSIGRAW